ncbi:MAG TPA: hypothetical protein VF367_04215 [Candidatus Limnocylindria bacterium]|jgi:PBP1b-binding outer membrane lipoprotein LpoB
MKRVITIALLALVAVGCSPGDNERTSPNPSTQSGAPLNDEAIGPSDDQAEIDD